MGNRHKRYLPDDVRRRRGLTKFTAVLIGFVILFIFADSRMRPIVENMSAYQARVFAVRCINDAMEQEMARTDIVYQEIVVVTQNINGEVTSIQTDMMQANALKTSIVDAILLELEKTENQELWIPVGTLLGNQLTSGRGPSIQIKVLPTGYVQSEIYSQFTSAGINQTLHQVMLKVNIQMIAIVPGYTVTTDTVTNYCIAQTVIVGTVPEGFTEINGDDSSTISKYNDYKQMP